MRNIGQCVRQGLILICVTLFTAFVPLMAVSAPYAAMVIDARSGEILHAENADSRLHPASLTKMMTLYIAFEAIENGEISLDTMVTISKTAAAEPPSKLGMRAGQKIKLRYLIRAAAIKSANDASTAIAEAIEGSEASFARRMNRTAKAMGMSRTTFKNAHGLTEAGHLSTARDMTLLGRHLFFDFPDYYNLFSRITADAGGKTVAHSNRRFLSSYKGADGIKTGYTQAAGFNLVASAVRGNERIITTVFGGRSTNARNAKVAELMDLGFSRAPTQVAVNRPPRPPYLGRGEAPGDVGGAGKTLRVAFGMSKSLMPRARPGADPVAQPPAELLLAIQDGIQEAVTAANDTPVEVAAVEPPAPEVPETALEAPEAEAAPETETVIVAQTDPALRPRERPTAPPPAPVVVAEAEVAPAPHQTPPDRPETLTLAPLPAGGTEQEIVTRVSSSGGRHWGINVGRYGSRYQAERVLLQTALSEIGTLDGALRKVRQSNKGFEANFVGMTQEEAALACRRLEARGKDCAPIGPS